MLELSAKINDFFILLFSIVVEGIPFILIGAVLSALVEIFVKPKKILSILPKNKFLQFSTMILLGNFIPVCECGNVPFARRMIKKEVPPHLSLTFLLSAPIVNPIVIISTIVAFTGDLKILFYRLLFTFIIAISAGYLFSRYKSEDLLNSNLDKDVHEHHHDVIKNEKTKSGFRIIKKEFLEMTAIFFFGASIAAAIQLLIPKELILSFNNSEWLAILAMMVLAFIISICSNVDAFFALAYSQIFPTSSILAFLVLGPMIDIKAIPMFMTIFKGRVVALITAFIFASTFLLSYLYFLFT